MEPPRKPVELGNPTSLRLSQHDMNDLSLVDSWLVSCEPSRLYGSNLNDQGPQVLVHDSICPRVHLGYIFLPHSHALSFGSLWKSSRSAELLPRCLHSPTSQWRGQGCTPCATSPRCGRDEWSRRISCIVDVRGDVCCSVFESHPQGNMKCLFAS